MDKEEIKALEPKYTGNQRELTEGEAEAIVHDPNFKSEDEDESSLDAITAAVAYGVFRRS
ncbi:hypothetical protein SAMN04487897_111118 [Paenibacillus sp. yr247]|uniref:hypothetical protein n=1 Tax=Paenibacillus sp. yr247 TaxID=1761880 RepID=UPI0008816327|nr:hypothetical protein [Paenibacillus sp. yr247]SDO30128.1 hypothetical protein SAMN04487897_111118 [Paenibacillus sp. yr247]